MNPTYLTFAIVAGLVFVLVVQLLSFWLFG
jgi:hypothetical protein